jgi:transcriptional regulator with XRE-family HTH domain
MSMADKDEPYAANLAKTMQVARALTGKSLREYAAFLKLNPATYHRVENGKGCDVSTLVKIHEVTGISYELLITGKT